MTCFCFLVILRIYGSVCAEGGRFTIYIAICDDEPAELDALTGLLNRWREERRVPMRYKTFQGTSPLLDAAKKDRFTLYLLDIMLPGTDGIDAAKEIRSFDGAAGIVFFTSSPDFAYKSYSVQAMDYLLKPVGAETLFPILDRLALEEQRPQEGLTVKCGSTLVRIPFSSLAYVEVNRKRLYFNLIDGQVREVSGALSDYEPFLQARPEFIRVHRSYIVNMLQAAELSPTGIRTFSGKSLPVSRLLYPQVQKSYLSLMFDGGRIRR